MTLRVASCVGTPKNISQSQICWPSYAPLPVNLLAPYSSEQKGAIEASLKCMLDKDGRKRLLPSQLLQDERGYFKNKVETVDIQAFVEFLEETHEEQLIKLSATARKPKNGAMARKEAEKILQGWRQRTMEEVEFEAVKGEKDPFEEDW